MTGEKDTSFRGKREYMRDELFQKDIILTLAVALMIFLGFYTLYASGMSLDYLVSLQAEFPQKMIVSQDSFSVAGFLFSDIRPVTLSVAALVIFSISLAVLSVRSPGKFRYLLILPIMLSGILFNFSVLFLFFALGLFVSCLYVIPLGETYFQELKKWKHFRVGSNAVGKAFFVLFLFISLGSFIAFSTDDSYKENFYGGLKNTVSGIAQNEVKSVNGNYQNGGVNEQLIQASMVQIRRDYQNLSDEQYKQMELQIREKIGKDQQAAFNKSQEQIDTLMDTTFRNSPLVASLLFWFPLLMSFTIWASLEFFRNLLFSPIAGICSFLLFHFFDFIEKDANYFVDDQKISEIEKKVERPQAYNS